MRKGLFLILTSFILLIFVYDALSAEEKSPGPPSTGQISLPWDKFQKLLNLQGHMGSGLNIEIQPDS